MKEAVPLFTTKEKDPRAAVTAYRLAYYIYIAALPLFDRAAFLQFLRMCSVENGTKTVVATERELQSNWNWLKIDNIFFSLLIRKIVIKENFQRSSCKSLAFRRVIRCGIFFVFTIYQPFQFAHFCIHPMRQNNLILLNRRRRLHINVSS